MKIAADTIMASVVGFVCLAVTPGCELSYKDTNRHEPSEQQTSESTGSDHGTSTSSTTSTSSSEEPGFGGDFVPGNPADKGNEIYRSNWQGHDVRCLGADYNHDGYFMSDIIDQTGALDLSDDGTATGHNFISPRTGLHYRFQGFREGSSSSDLITENPRAVTPGSGTLRCYWNPVEGL